MRLLRLAPERDRGSDAASRSSEGDTSGRSGGERPPREKTPITYEPSNLSVQETPVLVHTPQPEVPVVVTRRGSVMYDNASEIEDETEEDEEDDDEEPQLDEVAKQNGSSSVEHAKVRLQMMVEHVSGMVVIQQ
ncbi:unnamed protein product [Strongylus vulgaris]|uniref:Uncharacterized protein n=1 Tax=Strongylus vulgaris TaxID=40348 RepID=A0A3P7K329_STRVU|nr:unnamed protein product [Strongylus vulgaris]